MGCVSVLIVVGSSVFIVVGVVVMVEEGAEDTICSLDAFTSSLI